MSAGAVIARKQDLYMRRFDEAGATDPTRAKTLEELDCRDSFVFRRLVRAGVLVEASAGRFYVDRAKAAAFHARRRKTMLIALALASLTILALWWMR